MKYLLFYIMIISFCGCKRELPFYEVSQELKAYTIFEKNSYWVYQKNNENKKDTVTVEDKTIEKVRDGSIAMTEAVGIRCQSTFYQDIWINGSNGAVGKGLGSDFAEHYFASQYQVARTLFFSDKPVGYRLNISDGTYTDYVAHYPTYTVAGKEYTDVREYFSVLGFENPTAIDPRLPKRVWYARHVGIIKKELPNGEIWNLIHHDVKQ